jgi:hypothetical protein
MTIHKPIDIEIHRDKRMVVMKISQTGSLTMPKEAAHAVARELMRVIGEIEWIECQNGKSLYF